MKKRGPATSPKALGRLTKLAMWLVGFPPAVYFPTAPAMLDLLWDTKWSLNLKGHLYKQTWSWKFYAPARAAITRDWFGRPFYDDYCYDICHLQLLMPMEVGHDEP